MAIFSNAIFLQLTNSTTTCDSGYYFKITDSTTGTGLCQICPADCPSGYYCPNPDEPPQTCSQGSVPSSDQKSCTTCSAGQSCANPKSSQTTCSSPGFYSTSTGQSECKPCPAGQSCTSSSSQSCSGTGYFSEFGNGQCSQSQKGYFTPSSQMAQQQCPTGTYTSSTGQTSCSLCEAGKSCADTIGTKITCAAGSFSALGSTSCTSCQSGYQCSDTTQANQQPCPQGQYISGTTCTTCPAGKYCNATSIVGDCPLGTYSTGRGYCIVCPSFKACSNPSSPVTCSDTQYVDPTTSTCKTCPDGQVCIVNGIKVQSPRLCPQGYYKESSSATSCTICPEGQYCPNATVAISCPTNSISGTGYSSCIKCPAGFDCSATAKLSEITECSQGSYSLEGDGICTQCKTGEFCPQTNQPSQKCQAGTYQDQSESTSSCAICENGYSCNSDGLDKSSQCSTGSYSSFGATQCLNCPDSEKPCINDGIGFETDCAPGSFLDTTLMQCDSCSDGYECLNSQKTKCPAGMIQKASLFSERFQCVECPDLQICAYDQSGNIQNNYCYGKENGKTIISEFQQANRFPYFNYQFCIDCNDDSLSSQICTFATNYFTSQNGANLTCPSSRSKYNIKTGQNGELIQDYRFWDNDGDYEYPFCEINNQQPQTPEFSYSIFSCPKITEYVDAKISYCKQVYPGFAKLSTEHPTDTPVQNFYSVIEQNDFGTQSFILECPKTTTIVTEGGASASQACKLRETGDCKYSDSDYCHDGDDLLCYIGFSNDKSNPKNRNLCEQCEEGHYCSDQSEQKCEIGRFCLPVTEDSKQYAARPGRIIYQDNQDSYLDEHDCESSGRIVGYCPQKSYVEMACPDGYHIDVKNAHNQFNCHPNIPGSFNDYESTQTECTAGSYCPEAVRSLIEFIPCPPGHYSDSQSLIDKSDCSVCPQGSFCDQESTSYDIENCPAGFVCPNRTRHINENACPGGTYSTSSTKATSIDECLSCTAGSYCREGSPALTQCPKNAYCETNSTIFKDCPVGYYRSSTSGSSQSDCVACSSNYICPGGSDPIPCPQGFSNGAVSNSVTPSFLVCVSNDPGKFTSSSGISTQVCADGYFSLTNAKQCYKCPEGFYCSSGQIFNCSSGYYCPEGSSSQQTCPTGAYCPTQNLNRTLYCPPGAYCPAGATSITNTPQNYYNVQGEQSSSLHVCGNGYTCPGNSTGPYDVPCPSNTFAGSGISSCQACSNGKYCPPGSAEQLPCPLGYYCDNLTPFPQKCPSGTYGATVNLTSASDCTPCPGGYYCPQSGQTTYSDNCDPGYYCTNGSYTPQPDPNDPIQSKMGGLCPSGSYCPKGSTQPQNCPAGTYNSFPGMRAASDCISCTPGFYCEGSNSSLPTGPCQAGYYCLGGSSTPTQYQADAGYYALQGSADQIACEPGFYQPNKGSSSCLSCEAGTYCNSLGLSQGLECPAGFYCPTGSINPLPCKVGTFNPNTATSGSESCLNCTAGKYCDEEGLTYEKSPCSAGYFCKLGSNSKAPAINLTLSANAIYKDYYGMCPRGYYCEEGTSDPSPCPQGYYLNSEGGSSLSSCIKCPAGKYCSTTGLAQPDGTCSANYYCPAGSISATSQPCTEGHYCPANAIIEVSCPAGQYQDQQMQSSCKTCTQGNYCEQGAQSLTVCPQGSYCPSGTTAANQYYCPEGKYNNQTGQINSSACLTCPSNLYCRIQGSYLIDEIGIGYILDGYYNTNGGSKNPIPIDGGLCRQGYYCQNGTEISCDAGKYCNEYGLSNTVGDCYQGYFCSGTAKYMTQISTNSNDGIKQCSQSFYCPNGTTSMQACPIGTFSNGVGLFSQDDCSLCPQGYICDQDAANTSEITACPDKYYCPGNLSSASSKSNCPAGFYCVSSQIEPQPCPSGTYNNIENQSACQQCPNGSYCSYQTTSPASPPTGYTAQQPGLIAPQPCPNGKYIDTTTNQCTSCPVGAYCNQYGIVAAASDIQCPPGYYCQYSGLIDYQSFICDPGYYCTGGSNRQKCPQGYYCSGYANSALTGQCDEGYYCLDGSNVPNPTNGVNGNVCPTGYYCPKGTSSPQPCPTGTYNDKTGASNSSYCLSCPPNKLCIGTGLSQPNSNCPAGYYCLTNGSTTTNYLCDAGYRCPSGFLSKIMCEPGTYQPSTGKDSCIDCPAGSYCYNGSNPIISTTTCPAGFYCPVKTAYYSMYPCPAGTYSSTTGRVSSANCTQCDAGKYCARKGLTAPTGTCKNGYLCPAGSMKATGSGTDSSLCPSNYYCKAGVQYQCPSGTYQSYKGATDSSQCIQCPPGFYCTDATTKVACPAGYYCLGNLYSSSQAIVCPQGSYCPYSSIDGLPAPLKCSAGTYQDQTTQTKCKQCPSGKFCNTTGMITPFSCTLNMTCPAGSILPRPCGVGEYTDSNNTCQKCPNGKYCWPQLNQNGIQGQCEAGYICRAGSYSPRPYTDVSEMNEDSVYNGPAIPGYYSKDGYSLEQCLSKTFQPSRWSTTCLSCYAGHYCNNIAMTNLDNYKCPAGYLCLPGITFTNMKTCPDYYTTEEGQPHCMPCKNGYYSLGSGTCQICPSGSFCNVEYLQQGLSVIQPCIVGQSCQGGNPIEPTCDDGYYLDGKKCSKCDTGDYCTGGAVSGICQAGYFCSSGSSTPTPINGLCSIGRYCLHGTIREQLCPTGYYRPTRGGIQMSDCVACMAGYICGGKGVQPYECPKGFYCPVGDTQILPCPNGTYSQSTSLIAANECLNCPAGYLCLASNITDYTKYPCPKGKFCNQRALFAINCPAGSYRSTTGGRIEGDCSVCPPGYYCPEGSIDPIRCVPGTYCPEGSKYFSTCQGGYYCNDVTNMQQEICPANYKCPLGSSTPIQCEQRLICREGSEIGTLCEAGYYVSESQYGFVNECLVCPIGTYSTVNDNTCQPCTAGYLCYGGTNRKHPLDYNLHHGEICPKGYYCEEGSSEATPCPIGTYNGELGAGSITQCLLCPENTFNNQIGQQGCRPCGAYASSIEGSSTCGCTGNFRTFSIADSSCRCKSGYDYINVVTGVSEGQESGDSDCTPLVYDRCDSQTETRDVNGNCVLKSDCSNTCTNGKGTRSETLGICTCDDKQNVDTVCNQNCRDTSSKLGVQSDVDGNINITVTKNGKTTAVDLSSLGDVYGSFSCDSSNCSVKSTEMTSSAGFNGNYGGSSAIEKKATKLLRMLEEDDHEGHRQLQATANTAAIKNPVFCLTKGESMLFTIQDPSHYPVYMKDSVINSNPIFDYGSFLILQTQMKYKQATKNTQASFFAFTFSESGNYVFADAADTNQLMVVKILDDGETCADPDRYIQPLSADAVASIGVKQNQDIIIKPDVPLLVGIGVILILSIGTVMVGIGYCLHKGWQIRKAKLEGYRNKYIELDIDHQSAKTFVKDNDFEKYRSTLNDNSDEEDDLDNINLDIHQDILEAGQDYLKIFDDKKMKRLQEKKKKKEEILKLMKELEDMISLIGSDAMNNQMQIYNQEGHEDANHDEEDEEARERRREKEQRLLEEKERKNQEAEEKKRQAMMKEWSDRDRLKLQEAQQKMKADLELLSKEFNQDVAPTRKIINRNIISNNDIGDDVAMALYDQGDPNSRHNQIVKSIEQNPNLTDEEKESLLRAHQKQLMQIDELMENEKKRQDAELEKALKERIDKRKKALENKHKKEIQAEIKEREKLLNEEFNKEKDQKMAEIDDEIQQKIDDLGKNPSGQNYRQWVEDLKREREARKAKLSQEMDNDLQLRMKRMREEVVNKFTQGVSTDEELEALLKEQAPGMENAINELKQQKKEEEMRLKEALKKRKKDLKNKLKKEKEEYEEEIMSKDPIKEEENENKKRELMKGLNMDNNNQNNNEKQQAEQEFQKLLQGIDSQTETSQLMSQLLEQDERLASLLKQSDDEQHQKLEARRELLRQRKLLKKQQEQEQERLEERLKQMQLEEEEKAKIEQKFIKDLFNKQQEALNGQDNPDQNSKSSQSQKMVILNEFTSDAFLQRLSNLLMKQFLEKEATLKLLLQKYMDQRLIEKNNIKANFKIEYDKLNRLKPSLSEADYEEALKGLRLREENMLREVDLQFDKSMKEEELKLRGDLDKKHTDQQINLKKQEVEEQIKLKKELLIVTDSLEQADRDEQKERDALKNFEETKKREQDKRLRTLGIQKQEILRDIQKEIDNKYSDYEDLLRRKRDEEQQLQEQTLNIRKKLQDRKKKLKEQGGQELTEADQKKMIANYALQLETLESVFEEERRRQLMLMKKKQQQKQSKMVKQQALKDKVDEQEIDSIKNQLGQTFGAGGFFKPDKEEQIEEDDELLKKLKLWRQKRYEHKKKEEEKQLAETVIDLDQMTIKKLIIKLDNLERSLRELRKLKKLDGERPSDLSQSPPHPQFLHIGSMVSDSNYDQRSIQKNPFKKGSEFTQSQSPRGLDQMIIKHSDISKSRSPPNKKSKAIKIQDSKMQQTESKPNKQNEESKSKGKDIDYTKFQKFVGKRL